MIDLALLAGAVVAVGSVLFVFGCVCHLFKKSQPGFSTFENDVEVGNGQGFSIFTTSSAVNDGHDASQVTFEPLPDILAKTVSATALRPRISCMDKEKQTSAAKHITVYRPFPRSQLLYVKEIGIGWFGQVLLGDADKISVSTKCSRIVVKLLKDDATTAEQQLFLEEMAVYREIEHPNVLQLLGQCTESAPFLVILEHSPYMDLKSYQRKHMKESHSMITKGVTVRFLTDMAAGLASLHRHGFIHHDFACRNCLVMSDLTVKVGDYGVAEDHFREDYYDTGQDLLPVRWMSPESLQLNGIIWQVTQYTVEANIWSFGVSMWEVMTFGKRPYDQLTDEEVLQNVIGNKSARILLDELNISGNQRLNEVMEYCWLEPQQRPTVETIHAFLLQVYNTFQDQETQEHVEFDSKWDQASSKEPRVVVVDPSFLKSDKAIAEGGSIHNNVLNSDSVFVNFKPNNGIQVTADVHNEPLPHENICTEIEPETVYSGLPGVSKNNPQSHKNPSFTGALPVVSDRKSVDHSVDISPKQTNSGDIVIDMDKLKPGRTSSSAVLDCESQAEITNAPAKTGDVQYTENLCHEIDMNKLEKGPENIDDSIVILGGSEKQSQNLDLSSKDILSPIPSNISSPVKGNISTYNLTSTPFSKESPSPYLTADSNQTTKNGSTTIYFTAENTPINHLHDGEMDTHRQEVTEDFALVDTPTKGISETPLNVKNSVSRKLAKEVDDNVLDVILNETYQSTSEKNSASDDSDDSNEEDCVSRKTDGESRVDEEQLELLKMSIANALNSNSKGDHSSKEEDKNSGGESPTSDEYDIAREIYMSKGVTIPPTTRVTQRSLHIIPEDEIPEEFIMQEDNVVREKDTNSPVSTMNALKFVEPLEDSVPDSFEWDDFIGDELVGKVKYSESSPRQSMEFADWTLDNDALSSLDSESNNHSQAGSETSDNLSRPGSRTSSGLSTPYSASDLEDCESDKQTSEMSKTAISSSNLSLTLKTDLEHGRDSESGHPVLLQIELEQEVSTKNPSADEQQMPTIEKTLSPKPRSPDAPKKPPRLKLKQPVDDQEGTE